MIRRKQHGYEDGEKSIEDLEEDWEDSKSDTVKDLSPMARQRRCRKPDQRQRQTRRQNRQQKQRPRGKSTAERNRHPNLSTLTEPEVTWKFGAESEVGDT